jgi:hypothetical protein
MMAIPLSFNFECNDGSPIRLFCFLVSSSYNFESMIIIHRFMKCHWNWLY